jgi:hypothetical protein
VSAFVERPMRLKRWSAVRQLGEPRHASLGDARLSQILASHTQHQVSRQAGWAWRHCELQVLGNAFLRLAGCKQETSARVVCV